MRQYRFILASILLASVASAQSSLFAPASYSCRVPCDISFGATSSSNFIEHIVRYDATNITLCGMVLNVSTNVLFCDPLYYDFQDGAIQTSGPDLAAGAWGWNTGAVFSGTVSVTTSTTYRCTNPVFTNGFLPVGYALVGTSSNPATITVGGKTITVSRTFDQSIKPVSNSTVISMCTTGWANVGIVQMSLTHWIGTTVAIGTGGANNSMPDASSITTNASFVALTWSCNASTNYVVSRWSKYTTNSWQTDVYPISTLGCIQHGALLRIPVVSEKNNLSTVVRRSFGWRALYGPTPTDAQLRLMEIDARAEMGVRGYGQ